MNFFISTHHDMLMRVSMKVFLAIVVCCVNV